MFSTRVRFTLCHHYDRDVRSAPQANMASPSSRLRSRPSSLNEIQNDDDHSLIVDSPPKRRRLNNHMQPLKSRTPASDVPSLSSSSSVVPPELSSQTRIPGPIAFLPPKKPSDVRHLSGITTQQIEEYVNFIIRVLHAVVAAALVLFARRRRSLLCLLRFSTLNALCSVSIWAHFCCL